MHVHRTLGRIICAALLLFMAALIGGCGADTGVRVVSPDSAFETIFEDKPEDLVVLDVRTFGEFQPQRLPDAVLIDFYRADFAEQVAELDRDVPYLMYCRTGNRSGMARELMEELGFTDVSDIRGGIVAWLEDGHPFVIG